MQVQPPSVMPYTSTKRPGQRSKISALSAASIGAPVDCLSTKEDRSVEAKSACARMRLYCTGTSMVWVTRIAAANAR